MALNGVWNTPEKQFKPDVVRAEDLAPPGRHLGFHKETGKPQVYFTVGDGANAQHHICEFELEKIRVDPMRAAQMMGPNWFRLPSEWFPTEDKHLWCEPIGLHLLCPRCGMSLYVPGKGPGAFTIYVHWDMLRLGPDRYWRPLVSVDRQFTCDYSYPEINGIAQPASAIHNRCNARMRLELGRMFVA